MARLHRFYVPPQHNKYGDVPLSHEVWIHDENLLHQWINVLRYRVGQEVVLFDGVEHERLYTITKLDDKGAHFTLITDFPRRLPARKLYLFWSLLKKDKNDWVLQKCTELGVSVFVPLLADRSEKTGFSAERGIKLVIEAAEQCGRSDIPTIHEPQTIQAVLNEYSGQLPLYVCELSEDDQPLELGKEVGVMVGPEGGWSDAEQEFFKSNDIQHLNLHAFTLRAETAAVAATTKLIQ